MAAALDDSDEGITGINVTPLVDITLVLLIIFMATAHIIVHRAMGLNVPKVAHSEETPTQSLQILLGADKSLKLNGQTTDLNSLTVNLTQMSRLDPGLRITLSADVSVPWGEMAAVIDVVRGAGITRISTEVEQKQGTP